MSEDDDPGAGYRVLGRLGDPQGGSKLRAVGQPPVGKPRDVGDDGEGAEQVHPEVEAEGVLVLTREVEQELRGEDE
eukprot:CAMPEP_0198693330 /NCGR_PEP_ID=MMETSP1468-20131203/247817_1 /TAXON_ID=1461545 /ORGANISM="Mantoniella sp, Strain CCMP1436" /LENGTH=75 /DNA_ID=CAMNT_0044447895 /DNA_START=42 /DNA_END=269 /DNA_ORIENTATION=-